MFAVGKDGNLKLLTQGPTPNHLAPVYGQAPYLPASSSTLGGSCSGLNPYTGSYHCTAKTTQGLPIGAPIFQPSTGKSSSSTLGASLFRISLTITLRSGVALTTALQKRVTSSSWRPRSVHLNRIASVDSPPSRDQKHRMSEHPARDWSRI
jgi:hypothetical protein